MKLLEEPTGADSYAKWAAWSPKSKKHPVKLANIVSAIVIATSAVHLVSLPIA